ncbi:MAG: hypothetical protein ILP19_02625, partial [Oscillospiraceae bacterium]|nr:hypothetical protein [Oscillospiraceae bacterium]
MKITVRDPASYSVFAEMIVCGTVYPLSMTQGYQHGDIYTDGRAVLFHHDCGFAFLSGTAGEDTLEAVYSLMDNCGRRFVLFSEDDGITEFLSKKPGIHTDMRYFYEYSGAQKKALPGGMELREIDSDIISALDGRIVPAFSWSTDRFLSRGKGFAVMCGDEAASWAFSAAVSGDEI